MSKTVITPKIWKAVMAEHDAYWDSMRMELRRYKLAYEQRYWERQDQQQNQALLLIETSRMYEFVESYQASLFSKEPAVVVRGDIRGRGNAKITQSACNEFLGAARSTIEDASRLANLYPCAMVKLAIVDNKEPYKRVTPVAVPGWDIVVDVASNTWGTQRYVGHRYWVSVTEARERWGAKDYRLMERVDYLDKMDANVTRRIPKSNSSPIPTDELHQFISVVEVYDLLADKLYIWSDQWKDGQAWLDDGKEVEIDGVKHKFDAIPFRTVDNEPVVPIAPLYYSHQPHQPLRGIAPARRVYDQCQEINVIRTFQANATRKCARQWFMRNGTLAPDEIAKIVQGVDGEIIGVDLSPGQSLGDIIAPIPQSPTPPETYEYAQTVQQDLDRGSIMAPFTHGQAMQSGTTASEVTALASYSASEVGRLARERDSLIENVSRIYTAMLSLYLDDKGNDIIVLDGKVQIVKPADLEGDFTFFAQDGGSTPATAAAAKADLINAVPLLLSLGVDKNLILKEVIRTMNLPESFVPESAPKPSPLPAPSGVTPGGNTMPPAVPDTQLGLAPGSNPSPGQISQVLPNSVV